MMTHTLHDLQKCCFFRSPSRFRIRPNLPHRHVDMTLLPNEVFFAEAHSMSSLYYYTFGIHILRRSSPSLLAEKAHFQHTLHDSYARIWFYASVFGILIAAKVTAAFRGMRLGVFTLCTSTGEHLDTTFHTLTRRIPLYGRSSEVLSGDDL